MRIFVILALLVASGAHAQAPSRSGMSTSTVATNVRAYEELRSIGRCIARSRRSAALAIIGTAPDSAEEMEMLLRHVYGERVSCIMPGDQMRMPNIFARGAIAEGLLGTGGVPAEMHLSAPAIGDATELHGVARCYAVNHRKEVDDLLANKPGSEGEVKAVAALWNDFRQCMPGFKVRLNAPWIRFLLAEAALRLPSAAAGQGG